MVMMFLFQLLREIGQRLRIDDVNTGKNRCTVSVL